MCYIFFNHKLILQSLVSYFQHVKRLDTLKFICFTYCSNNTMIKCTFHLSSSLTLIRSDSPLSIWCPLITDHTCQTFLLMFQVVLSARTTVWFLLPATFNRFPRLIEFQRYF